MIIDGKKGEHISYALDITTITKNWNVSWSNKGQFLKNETNSNHVTFSIIIHNYKGPLEQRQECACKTTDENQLKQMKWEVTGQQLQQQQHQREKQRR